MKYICIFCEAELKRIGLGGGKEHFQPYGGGEVRLNFDYGSRHDWMGSRNPTSSPNAKVHEIDFGHGPIPLPEADGSEPDEDVLNFSNRADRLSACNRIQGSICDDCFEKKAELFDGFEKGADGSLTELVP